MENHGATISKHTSLSTKATLILIAILSVVLAFQTYVSCRSLIASVNDQYKKSAHSIINLASRDEIIRHYIMNAVFYDIIALLAIALLFYAAIRREVFGPLQQLTGDAQEIAIGNLEKRTSLERADELGQLSCGFDTLADALQRKEKENSLLRETLQEKRLEAEVNVQTDHLTQLENHRSFQVKLEAELNRSSRTGTPVSLLFCDLDGLKSFNDAHGHLLGDKVLVDVAQTIKDSIRDYDVASRYGGEEFAVILANTDSDEALTVGERIRKSVEELEFNAKSGVAHITVSVGVATYPRDAKRKELLIAASDYAMYESKTSGGNFVTMFKTSGDSGEVKAS